MLIENKKWFKKLGIFVFSLIGVLGARAVLAKGKLQILIEDNLGDVRRNAGLQAQSEPADLVPIFINALLGVIAIIFFVIIIVSGFRWMTAGGNEETVGKAKKNMANAVIGLLIVMFSYAITVFVFNVILGD